MHAHQASRTAEAVARLRAAHQLFDRPLVFEDPVAVNIIGPEAAATLSERPADPEQLSYQTALRAAVVARSRFAEDSLRVARSKGVCQYVVLGAGLDTSSYRQIDLDLRMYEVDHPATQAWKLERLRAGSIPIPSNLVFAPINFETQTIEAGLQAAGFDRTRPAFFSWLGVTPYLTREAILSTLTFVRRACAPGSSIVFDYMIPREHRSEAERAAFQARVDRVASLGEPWRTFIPTDQLLGELQSIGFSEIESLSGAEINQRYFAQRADRLCVAGVARLARAST